MRKVRSTGLPPSRRNPQRSLLTVAILAGSLLGMLALKAYAATIEIFPLVADCNEQFETVANSLQPGDELVLHGGTYSQNCRRAITANGAPSSPILIRAVAGEIPIVTRPADNIDTHNNIEIVNSSYLILRGLHFRGGSIGVRFIGGHHIILQDSEISETGNNAIAMNSGNTDSFTIRRNHIHHTGLSTSGTTEGEGMYVGCNNATCIASHHMIENNYIHHLRGTSDGGNDGIEVKVGSHGNIIRNNVIHDTNIGMQYPCIFVYGGGSSVNIVEGNAMWNCGEGIQVVADAVIRNNIILNSNVGITAAPHVQVPQMRNVTLVNNSLYGHTQCLYIRWSGATTMILANNAFYCPGRTAVDASGLTESTVTVRSNYLEGNLSGGTIDNSRFFAGGSATSAFVNPTGFDLWPSPTSVLIGRADANHVPTLDFNEATRAVPYDVGAYETEGLPTNPGWKVGPGFKPTREQMGTPPATPTDVRVE